MTTLSQVCHSKKKYLQNDEQIQNEQEGAMPGNNEGNDVVLPDNPRFYRDQMADWFVSEEGTSMCPFQFQMALRNSLRVDQ